MNSNNSENVEAISKILENSDKEDDDYTLYLLDDYTLYLSDEEEKDLDLPINDNQPEEDLEPFPDYVKRHEETNKIAIKGENANVRSL